MIQEGPLYTKPLKSLVGVSGFEPPAPASRTPDPSPETPVFRGFLVGEDPSKPGDIPENPRIPRIYDPSEADNPLLDAWQAAPDYPPESDNPLLDAWLASGDPIAWIGLLGGETIDG